MISRKLKRYFLYFYQQSKAEKC